MVSEQEAVNDEAHYPAPHLLNTTVTCVKYMAVSVT